MDYIEKQKMRWRSRRSMLELDLYFDRFIRSGKFDSLSDKELEDYNELLKMEDSEIILLFQGKVRLSNKEIQVLIDNIVQHIEREN
jgi:succinate dehydrogenase flavin-adding protein (antitoxin of CptAB toxin-antitoxin module)